MHHAQGPNMEAFHERGHSVPLIPPEQTNLPCHVFVIHATRSCHPPCLPPPNNHHSTLNATNRTTPHYGYMGCTVR